MDDARTGRRPERSAGATTQRPAPTPTGDLGFVTPWADETTLVVDISGDRPVARIESEPEVLILAMRQWLVQIADIRSEITGLKEEVRRLREAIGRTSGS